MMRGEADGLAFEGSLRSIPPGCGRIAAGGVEHQRA